MIALQQCPLIFRCSVRLSSRGSAALKTWLSGKEYARLHTDTSYQRFRVSKAIFAAHELFKHSNNNKGATLPSKERLDEVEKILGCVSCSPTHSLSAPFHSLLMNCSVSVSSMARSAAAPFNRRAYHCDHLQVHIP